MVGGSIAMPSGVRLGQRIRRTSPGDTVGLSAEVRGALALGQRRGEEARVEPAVLDLRRHPVRERHERRVVDDEPVRRAARRRRRVDPRPRRRDRRRSRGSAAGARPSTSSASSTPHSSNVSRAAAASSAAGVARWRCEQRPRRGRRGRPAARARRDSSSAPPGYTCIPAANAIEVVTPHEEHLEARRRCRAAEQTVEASRATGAVQVLPPYASWAARSRMRAGKPSGSIALSRRPRRRSRPRPGRRAEAPPHRRPTARARPRRRRQRRAARWRR